MTAALMHDNRFRLTESQARELSTQFGTPLYVVNEKHFRERIRKYLTAFRNAYPNAEISFASKANSTLALIAIAYQEGCNIDVASEGELRAAMKAGVPAAKCHMHGNNKSRRELEFAIEQGVGQILVDHFGEIEMLAEIMKDRSTTTSLVLRLAPGVDPITHHKIATGQADTKFGFNIADGSAERATKRLLDLGLPLVGYHCHVGSQLVDPEAQRSGGALIAEFAVEMKQKHGFAASYLNVGGGLGVSYTKDDQPMQIEEYCELVVAAIKKSLEGSGLEPTLAQEPGRSIVGESGVTLYEVGVIKVVPIGEAGTRTYVCVNGGMADNPRPALYGSKYTVERVAKSAAERKPVGFLEALAAAGIESDAEGPGRPSALSSTEGIHSVTVSGRHCETDKLFENVELPTDLQVGDLLQVLCTGAYNSSMANNYNRYQRPGTVLIREDGSYQEIQKPDSWDEMFAREIIPGDLKQ